jgi:hypothetical protein
LISLRSAIGRPVAAPPGVSADRLATMNDPAFKADIKKRRMLNNWRSGKEVQEIMAAMLATPKPLLPKTQMALGWAK